MRTGRGGQVGNCILCHCQKHGRGGTHSDCFGTISCTAASIGANRGHSIRACSASDGCTSVGAECRIPSRGAGTVVAGYMAPPFAAPMAAAPASVPSSELQGCSLRNLALGQEMLLTGSDSYTMERSNNVGFSIRCDVVDRAQDEIKFIKFFYNGKDHDEFGVPCWLDGDSYQGAYIVPVPYFSWCGNTTIVVQGRSWTAVRFEKVDSLVTRCPQQQRLVRRKWRVLHVGYIHSLLLTQAKLLKLLAWKTWTVALA
jgi:hypothetical protein